MKTAAEVLREAADLIEAAPKLARGKFRYPAEWLDERGFAIDGAGADVDEYDDDAPPMDCFCSVGAIDEASDYGFQGDSPAAQIALSKALRSEVNILDGEVPISTIFRWNDFIAEDKAAVVRKLREAADQCES